jgi:hypothetical protein
VQGKPRFSLGAVVQTQGVVYEFTPEEILSSLVRHANGDWGDLDEEDKQENELALEQNERLLSAYKFEDGSTMYVITEWDRSATTVQLPDEY